MRARPVFALPAMLVACLAPAAHAQTSPVERAALKIFQDYAIDGRIDACRHTSQELELAHDNIPPDIEQYASDYPATIQAAIEARARGDCEGRKPATGLIRRPTTVAPPTGTPTPPPTPVPTAIPTKTVVPEPPAPESLESAGAPAPAATGPDVALERVATARPANDAPVPVLLLGVLAAMLALLGVLVLSARHVGLGDSRLAPARHAFREAAWRSRGTWDDFRDWLRLGR